jgi:hypothetical protein
VLKQLDERYARGIFTGPSPFAFDLWEDNLVDTVWMYLRKNLPAFRGGTDIGQLPRAAVGESGNIIAINVPALRHG